MSKSIYELHKILGKYCAYETDHVRNIDTCGEIDSYTSREFEGSFEANIYHFGELSDIDLMDGPSVVVSKVHFMSQDRIITLHLKLNALTLMILSYDYIVHPIR